MSAFYVGQRLLCAELYMSWGVSNQMFAVLCCHKIVFEMTNKVSEKLICLCL